ncbi:MAG: MucR family transcriptional regulator [Acetobacteraceae bacterium]|nr:MucR family transcriptional regulator [Acetobacteraceae bacterium]
MTGLYEAGVDDRTLTLATKIVSAYIGAHTLPADALPALIREVYLSLTGLQTPSAPVSNPAVPVRRSIFSDHLVCLEDGLPMKMLKRHLLTVHHMTPDEYRTKWSLSAEYPMVAPDYAKVRSALAKQSGLGKKPEDRPKAVRAGNERKRRGEA